MTLPRKDRFHLPDGVIYLDGNSLGPLARGVEGRVSQAMSEEWGRLLIRGWNDAGWMAQPGRIGDRIGRLIGAPPGSVVMGDTLSIKVYQALASALEMRPERRVILSDAGNFPTDLYMAEGLVRTVGRGHTIETPAPENVAARLAPDVAVLMLTHVDYSTGRLHDMNRLTEIAHGFGVPVIWDLAHSAGAVPVDLTGCAAEFAVGCTYKYLNSGPGGPAFIYVRPDLADTVDPALAGWLGHAAPFAFEERYRPGDGIERMRVGTPPVLQMAALDAALDAWAGVTMDEIRAASLALGDLFIAEVEAQCPELALATPRDHASRGSQVSFRFEHGYAAMQALIARGVIGDFRAPDIMRFGITPLYLDAADIRAAAAVLGEVLGAELWRDPAYNVRAAVT